MSRLVFPALAALVVSLILPPDTTAWAQDEAPPGDVPSLQEDLPGYVPDLEPPALTIGGYVDIGFADAAGDGTSFHPDDRRLPLDYGTDSFATAVNSRGDVASREAGGRFTNAFLPRSAGIGGRPSFLLNTVDVDLQHAPRDSALLVFVRLQFLPRLTERGSETRVVVEQAFGRLQPLRDHELMLFLGRVDPVFGIEYLENQAPLRTGVTPSLIARYTTGTTLGGKLLYRLQIAPLLSAVSLNVAATNNAPFSDALQAAEASLPGRPVLSGRAGYELNLPGFQLKLGGSGLRGPRNDQADREALQRGWGADLRAYALGVNFNGEYLHLDQDQGTGPKLTGAGPGFIASAFKVRGFYGQLSITAPWSFGVLRRTIVYGRGEQRRAWFDGFSKVKVRRLTVGARLDLWETLALKGELLLNRELEGAPDVDNDVWAASAVWSF
jgi:hypothetical protein